MVIDEAITLKKLDIFITFMRLRNLARVSEALEMSVVSVHRALHSLEESLRCPLFKREGRNLVPLEAAHVFTEYARRSLGECEQGVERIRAMANAGTPRLRVGALYSLTLHCIPKLIIGLKMRRPELDIDLTMGSSRELLHDLEEGNVDAIIIGVHEPVKSNDLLSIPVFEDEVFFAAPVASRYGDNRSMDLVQAKAEKFVVLADGFVTAESFRNAFGLAGYAPDVIMKVNDIFSLINLVSQGIGFSLLPGRARTFSSRVQLIPVSKKYQAPQLITLLLPKHRERDPNLLALAAECRMYGRQDADLAGAAQ